MNLNGKENSIDLSEGDWCIIYMQPLQLTKDPKIKYMQFKLTHHIMTCNYALQVWEVEWSNKRYFWVNGVDNIEHFFHESERV